MKEVSIKRPRDLRESYKLEVGDVVVLTIPQDHPQGSSRSFLARVHNLLRDEGDVVFAYKEEDDLHGFSNIHRDTYEQNMMRTEGGILIAPDFGDYELYFERGFETIRSSRGLVNLDFHQSRSEKTPNYKELRKFLREAGIW